MTPVVGVGSKDHSTSDGLVIIMAMRSPGQGQRGEGVRPAAAGKAILGEATPPILEQDFDRDSLHDLRVAVRAVTFRAGMPPGRASDVLLAVHELAANAVRHGAGHGQLRLGKRDHALHCEITDGGAELIAAAGTGSDADPGAGTGPGDAPQWRIEPGHGLWVVRQIADQTALRFGRYGTTATVSFGIGPAGPLPPVHLTQHTQAGCSVLAVTGHLRLSSGQHLIDAVDELIAAIPAPRLILDLAGLTFCDSSGLAAVLAVQKRIRARPAAEMILVGLPGELTRRMSRNGLTGRFTLADTVGDAIGEITRQS